MGPGLDQVHPRSRDISSKPQYLFTYYDFETGRLKGDSSEPGDLSSFEAQLDCAATSSSSSSDDESYLDELEDSISIDLAL